MAELAARAGRAVHRAPVHDEDAADADLDGQVQDDPRPGARAAPGLGQPGERGVVADEQGDSGEFERLQGDVAPPHAGRLDDRRPADRPGHARGHRTEPPSEAGVQGRYLVAERSEDREGTGVAARLLRDDAAAEFHAGHAPALVADVGHAHQRAVRMGGERGEGGRVHRFGWTCSRRPAGTP